MAKEEKKEEKKAAPKVLKANEELFKVGQELELGKEKVKFLVKEIKGVDLILARKDYK